VRRDRTLIVVVAAVILAAVSFVGSTVGALITGGEPLRLFEIPAPQIKLVPGEPFPGIPVSNSMLASWLTILVVVGLFLASTRRMSLVPSGLQNALEWFCETVSGLIAGLAGNSHERKFFPLVSTIFLFVLFNAWLALLPGFETVLVNGTPLLHNANADINVPLVLALVSFVFVEYWGFRAKGLSYVKGLWTPQENLFFAAATLFAAILEFVTRLVRLVSFTFRLFGNMLAGLALVGIALFLVPMVLPSVFYGLEAVFGFVQAVIFAGLTLVFGYAAVASEEQ
jgi:F-type H+-transporting ATPase subunit a